MKIKAGDIPAIALAICLIGLVSLTLYVVFSGPADKSDTYIIQDSRGHYIQCHKSSRGTSCDWDNPLSQEEYDKAQGK